MPRADVQLNSAGMAELLNSDGVRAELTGRAESVLGAARSGAPVVTGAYRDSLHIEQHATDRAAVRVVAGSDHGLEVEARTGNLARALDAAGGEAGTVQYVSKSGKKSRISHKQAENYRRRKRGG